MSNRLPFADSFALHGAAASRAIDGMMTTIIITTTRKRGADG